MLVWFASRNDIYYNYNTNVLYFVVIHGGPLLLIAFFNLKLINALKHRQRRRAEMGKNWYQQDVTLVPVSYASHWQSTCHGFWFGFRWLWAGTCDVVFGLVYF